MDPHPILHGLQAPPETLYLELLTWSTCDDPVCANEGLHSVYNGWKSACGLRTPEQEIPTMKVVTAVFKGHRAETEQRKNPTFSTLTMISVI